MYNHDSNTIQEFKDSQIQLMRVLRDSLSDRTRIHHFATTLQFFALKVIAENPNISIGDLANQLKMSSPAVAQFSDRLVRSKLVDRSSDESDRRIVHLNISKKGEKVINSLEDKSLKKLESVLQYLSPEDLKELLRIQKKLLQNIQEQNA